MDDKVHVILDTDICDDIDDLYALLVCIYHPRIDLRAVTIVNGDVAAKGRYVAKIFRELNIQNIPIGIGNKISRERLLKNQRHPDINFLDRYGSYVKPSDPESQLIFPDAYELMCQTLNNSLDKTSVIGIGALSNIAELVYKYPYLKEKIKNISLMGGEISLPMAEHNIMCDPEAAQIVFNSGLEIFTGTYLESKQIALSMTDVAGCFASRDDIISKIIWESTLLWAESSVAPTSCLYDLAPVFWLLDKELIKTKRYNIQVELEGKYTRGYTVPIESDIKNVRVSIKTDYKEIIKQTLKLLVR